MLVGPYESALRDILFFNAPCSPEPAIIMLRYRSRMIPSENVCFTPYASAFPPFQHLTAYGMAVAGLHAFVKLDRQPLPPLSYVLTVNGKHEISGGYLELEKTHQFQRLLQVAKNMGIKPIHRRP